MNPKPRALLFVCLLPLLGSTGCTTTTLQREFRSAGRDLARGFSRAGHGIENGLKTLGRQAGSGDFLGNVFDSGHSRPASYGSRETPSITKVAARPSGVNAPAPSNASNVGKDHPFATPVPGRSGYVKLPGREHFPEVDVRGIAPGTSIDVPDPDQPGGSIGFRVP